MKFGSATSVRAKQSLQSELPPKLAGWAFAIALTFVITASFAHAQTFTTLYTFKGGANGEQPGNFLVIDTKGNLYGTTQAGGKGNCSGGCGTVFKLTEQKADWIYRFKGAPSDGSGLGSTSPVLAMGSDGKIYGATPGGGASTDCGWGCGTIFTITTGGVESVLHSFAATTDGYGSGGMLVDSNAGILYAATTSGGPYGQGAIVKLEIAPPHTETVLYGFCQQSSNEVCLDGQLPLGALVRDAAGNLYGTTLLGGANNAGTIFKLTPGRVETVLYNFCSEVNCADGSAPEGGLFLDPSTNTIYGTTSAGGTGTCPSGCGALFSIDTDGNGFTVLHSFAGSPNDGANPYGTVVRDAAGNLYGTTANGGNGVPAAGTVFEFSSVGILSVLHNFDAEDGSYPSSNLVYSKGNLYGTTQNGGDLSCPTGIGCGTVFKVTP
jgi:uncharacterized repeat protein (TIGR03803 family)